MNPIHTALLSAESLSDLLKDSVLHASKRVLERALRAQNMNGLHNLDPEGKLENFRSKCIGRICSLQQEVILYVSDLDFLRKVMPLLLEHTATIYIVETHQDLTFIDMSLSRIENAIDYYKKERERRKFIRIVAVLVSLMVFLLIGLFLYLPAIFGIIISPIIPILHIPLPVFLWSVIGSFSAILYRFTNAGDIELNEPLRWLYSRPLTGIIMGIISYLVIKVGLVTIQGQGEVSEIANNEVIWLIAFLASFSDKFSEALLKAAVGKFGGDKESELVTMEMRAKSTKIESSSDTILMELDKIGSKMSPVEQAPEPVREGDNKPEPNTGVNPVHQELQSSTEKIETSQIEILKDK